MITTISNNKKETTVMTDMLETNTTMKGNYQNKGTNITVNRNNNKDYYDNTKKETNKELKQETYWLQWQEWTNHNKWTQTKHNKDGVGTIDQSSTRNKTRFIK